MTVTVTKTIPETCDIWDTNNNFDNWEPEFMTIFVTWHLRVTLDSIRNSCDVYLVNVWLGSMSSSSFSTHLEFDKVSSLRYKSSGLSWLVNVTTIGKVVFVPKLPNWKIETIYTFKMARLSITISSSAKASIQNATDTKDYACNCNHQEVPRFKHADCIWLFEGTSRYLWGSQRAWRHFGMTHIIFSMLTPMSGQYLRSAL